jgi:hypothetical protein
VAPEIISELNDRIPDFRKAYDVDGMTPNEFDVYWTHDQSFTPTTS